MVAELRASLKPSPFKQPLSSRLDALGAVNSNKREGLTAIGGTYVCPCKKLGRGIRYIEICNLIRPTRYHGTGGVTASTCLMSGITLAIGHKFSLSSFWSDVRDSEATFVIYVGETARYLLSAPPSPLDKQHKVRCIHGNGLRPDVWTKFQERFGIPEVAEFFNSTEGMFGVTNWSKNHFGRDAVGHQGFIIRQLFKNKWVSLGTGHPGQSNPSITAILPMCYLNA